MKPHPLFLLMLAPVLALAQPAKLANPQPLPDLLPDAPSSAYRAAGPRLFAPSPDGLDGVVATGKRNLEWLEHINSLRSNGDKLSLTSKDTQHGIPIDAPTEYSPALVLTKLAELRERMPQPMAAVIFGSSAFTDRPPLPVQDYLQWSRDLDRAYQLALRWRLMADWLPALRQRRHSDIRGWYFLSRLPQRAEKLRGFPRLGAPEKAQLRAWLLSLCFNYSESDEIAGCAGEIDGRIAAGEDLEAYYAAKAPGAQAIFDSYFTIPDGVARPEIRWNSGSQLLAPFADPGQPEVQSFLTVNIQDEWRFGEWQLDLPLRSPPEDLPHVVFAPDVTPHVNGLGGNEIVMNSQQPLTEYDAQWTIRHEYGHVLGFPDCYVEFYEQENGVIVNYQFDVNDLMCSRRGHILDRHVAELKRAYQ